MLENTEGNRQSVLGVLVFWGVGEVGPLSEDRMADMIVATSAAILNERPPPPPEVNVQADSQPTSGVSAETDQL